MRPLHSDFANRCGSGGKQLTPDAMKFRQIPAFCTVEGARDRPIDCRKGRTDLAKSGQAFSKRPKKLGKAYCPSDTIALFERDAQIGMTRLIVAARPSIFQNAVLYREARSTSILRNCSAVAYSPVSRLNGNRAQPKG
jgi:hypothetical protein